MGNRLLLAGTVLLAAGCHRSALQFGGDGAAPVSGPDLAAPAPDAPSDLPQPAPDLPPPAPDRAPLFDGPVAPDLPALAADAPPASPPPMPTPGCTPQPESCNGRDDDCDGKVDEELAPIPCPNGGSRYCVAGRISECPRVCEVCRPGSRRICFISYCTYWGTQTCAGDGRSFGLCGERAVPVECEKIAKARKNSPELERCCIDNGYCCLDEHDLDKDGDRTEMLGRCAAVTCDP